MISTISPRQRVQQQRSLPDVTPSVTQLSPEDSRAEARFEGQRLDRLRSFDNQPGDLDPRPDFVSFDHPGHSMAPPAWGHARFQDTSLDSGLEAGLTYQTQQAITLLPTPPGPWLNDLGQLVPPPSGAALLTETEGRRDPNTRTWEIYRYTNAPSREILEEIKFDGNQGTKTMWNLAP